MGDVYEAQLVFREREYAAEWLRYCRAPSPQIAARELTIKCQSDPALKRYIAERIAEARAKHEAEQDSA